MNVERLQDKLLAAARHQAPDDRVPYAFEKRILALVRAHGNVDRWTLWARGLWRAAVLGAVIAVATGTVSHLLMPAQEVKGEDLSQEFVNTLLASADQPDVFYHP